MSPSRRKSTPAAAPVEPAAQDYVDRFIQEWQDHRPALRVPRLAPLMRVLRLASVLERELAGSARLHAITGAQFQVLAALRRRDPTPQSLSALSRIAILTSGSMTSLVDRLEERQFVRRQPHPADRRGVLLELTAKGRAVIDAALATRLQRLHQLADLLGPDQLDQLSHSLRTLLLAADAPLDSDGASR